ncbi:hypothetical protein CH333_00285 [candidate division WOR-3 bacterium JGI_Cruoil_03_44_89]|uniref:Glycosyltransferase WbuB n=1 Tax=candidate division WOR-3 bacterium JGI_Cruoil_03_44_89 TaxID=1973748 RepID=A0A235BZ17_UNCW3|nr:MAG: hypothetical protein CH333_00285 [candidate division WOR-3 bacterium JGI_Cruoil_03_44_89]
MHFLILTQYFPPEVGGAQIRLYSIAKQLIRKGNKVTIVTSMPNYPAGKIVPAYRRKFFLREKIGNIPVIRTWIYASPCNSTIVRLLNYFSFTFSSIYGILSISKPDYIFVESPPLFLGISGYFTSRLKRCPYIFNISDLWPDSVREMGIIKNRFLLKLAEMLESFLYKKALIVNGVTEGIVDALKNKKQVFKDKVLFLPNGVDSELFKPLPTNKQLAMNLQIQGKKIFIYAGLHGYAQGLETLIQSARILKQRDDIFFLLVGDGPEKINLKCIAQKQCLKNIAFLPPCPFYDMPKLFSMSMASIVLLRKIDLFKGAVPSKVFSALSCSVPVIYSGEGECARIIRETNSTIVVEPENAEALAKAVRDLADDTELAHNLGKLGRELVERKYSWTMIVDKWLIEFKKRIQSC